MGGRKGAGCSCANGRIGKIWGEREGEEVKRQKRSSETQEASCQVPQAIGALSLSVCVCVCVWLSACQYVSLVDARIIGWGLASPSAAKLAGRGTSQSEASDSAARKKTQAARTQALSLLSLSWGHRQLQLAARAIRHGATMIPAAFGVAVSSQAAQPQCRSLWRWSRHWRCGTVQVTQQRPAAYSACRQDRDGATGLLCGEPSEAWTATNPPRPTPNGAAIGGWPPAATGASHALAGTCNTDDAVMQYYVQLLCRLDSR